MLSPKKKPTRKPVSADVLARFDQRRLALEHNSSNTADPLLSLVALSRVEHVGRVGNEQHWRLSIALFPADAETPVPCVGAAHRVDVDGSRGAALRVGPGLAAAKRRGVRGLRGRDPE